jgi:hypothetical protein
LKNSINLVAIKKSNNNNIPTSIAGTSKGNKDSAKSGDKIPKLTPMTKGYSDGLGILTPATSPKNQQQQQQQHQTGADNIMLNGQTGNAINVGSVENLQNIPLTPVSPAVSPSSTSTISFQQLKKPDS